MPRLARKPGAPPIRGVLNMVSHACDLHQLGIMYGMMTASEKNGLNGRSVRTISHASTEPSRIAQTETQKPISSEWSSGSTSSL